MSSSCKRSNRGRRRKEKRRRRSRGEGDSSDAHRRKKSSKKHRKRDRDTNDQVTRSCVGSNNTPIDANDVVEANAPAVDSYAPATIASTKPIEPAAAKGPMTQAQYQQLHSQIHEVIDPHTGRTRWQRGTGEIVERIVSRQEHLSLNACATRGDGASFGRDVVKAALKND